MLHLFGLLILLAVLFNLTGLSSTKVKRHG